MEVGEVAVASGYGFACVDVYHAFNGPKGDLRSQNTFDVRIHRKLATT